MAHPTGLEQLFIRRDTAPTLPRITMKDGSIVIFVTLALARLREILLTSGSSSPGYWPYQASLEALRDDLNTMIIYFGKRYDQVSVEARVSILDDFKTAAEDIAADRGEQWTDEFLWLFSIIEAFHRKMLMNSDNIEIAGFCPTALYASLHQRLKGDIFGSLMPEFLEEWNEIQTNSDPSNLAAAEQELRKAFEGRIVEALEDYVQEHVDLNTELDFDPSRQLGARLANLVSNSQSLVDLVYNAVYELCEHLKTTENAAMVHFWCGQLILNIVDFFTPPSPLLAASDQDDNASEGVWQEYEPADLEDVPRGPEHIAIEEVSDPIPTPDESECGICTESHEGKMRKLKTCIHTYCEECLEGQLAARHPSRTRCALCRTEFFPDEES